MRNQKRWWGIVRVESVKSSLVGGHLVGRAHGEVRPSQRLQSSREALGPPRCTGPQEPAGSADVSGVILILTKLYDFHIGSVTESTLWR
uniref:Uncharacterized protein n=1 Tax=Knipowitschia caucasica TaxID=637954 RepID=A0AAV2LIY2_KNICA